MILTCKWLQLWVLCLTKCDSLLKLVWGRITLLFFIIIVSWSSQSACWCWLVMLWICCDRHGIYCLMATSSLRPIHLFKWNCSRNWLLIIWHFPTLLLGILVKIILMVYSSISPVYLILKGNFFIVLIIDIFL